MTSANSASSTATKVSKKVVLVAAAAALAVGAGWYMLLWTPQGNALSAAHTRATAAAAQRQQLEVKLRGLETARKTLPEKQAELAKLKAALPDGARLDDVLHTLDATAAGAGVDLSTVSPTQPSPLNKATTGPAVSGVTELRVSFAVSGTYQQVMDFVGRLNHTDRLIMVDGVSYTPANGTTPGGARVNASLSGRMFFESPLAAPPAAPATAAATTATTTSQGGKP